MTIGEFIVAGNKLGTRAGVIDGLHHYFQLHTARLFKACNLFDLFRPMGDVLEIGPFYGYMPFILQPYSSSYTVLEGPDPAVRPLEPLYKEHSIVFNYVDLIDLFGSGDSATPTLPVADSTYDTVLCWDTMEHFSFNPAKFVRELHRSLKPGGRACITVPNKASFQNLFALFFGRGERNTIDAYYSKEDYESNGKKVFYGFHWREYSSPELSHLFGTVGFRVQKCGTFVTFMDHGRISPGRKLARKLSQAGSAVLPRYGTHVYLQAVK